MASLTYHISEEQYVAALRLHVQLRPRWTRWLRYLMAILGVLILVTSLLLKTYWLAVGGAIYVLVATSSFQMYVRPMAQRAYRRYPAMHQAQTLELNDGELTMRSSQGESRVPWNFLIQWAENAEFMLLYLQPNLYYIVPKVADPDQAALGELRSQLQAHVGPARK
ncbi:MAG: YcxB family protein [Comamonas sp.]|jgi:hypothetical protein|uniref:YcxB family protein n=1 Tax=Comamonas sp. TaxID=34028 RepID=UPI00282938CE|nr:YcxB family protein [Comamonas sp.]MDR0214216.1 YcxB family protein [Comamonas sp.]